MLSRFKRGLKRTAVFLLILGVIAVLVITFTTFGGGKLFGKKVTEVIIDTDSGNEIDDLFAITRALTSPELKVIGLTSAHWGFHKEAGDSSLEVSQRLNEQILTYLEKTSIPHPRGAREKLWYFGKPSPNPSPAAEFIVQQARGKEKGEKLNVVCLGALTNIASAIMMDTSITSRIRLYCMGLKYDPKTKVWNKNEFNTKNDLDAVDYLLNRNGLEMHIMTATTSAGLVFSKGETEELMENGSGIWQFLLKKWEEKFPGHDKWIMWDVALIEALIDPDLAKSQQVITPPENSQRPVKVYTYINKELMKASFWSGIMKTLRTENQ